MKIAIHQPEHLPWLGFLHKASLADAFVLLDNVQFRKNYFQNRNRIRTANGSSWLTVPVKRHPLNCLISQIKINNTHNWQDKIFKSISLNYQKAPYFKKYSSFFKETYSLDREFLSELNIHMIRNLLSFFGIKTNLVVASGLSDISGSKGDLLLSICQRLGADEYISGISGREYLDTESFKRSGIKVTFQDFFHPVYQQLYQPFIPCMSGIDLLFNYGDKSQEILLGAKTPRLDYQFK